MHKWLNVDADVRGRIQEECALSSSDELNIFINVVDGLTEQEINDYLTTMPNHARFGYYRVIGEYETSDAFGSFSFIAEVDLKSGTQIVMITESFSVI